MKMKMTICAAAAAAAAADPTALLTVKVRKRKRKKKIFFLKKHIDSGSENCMAMSIGGNTPVFSLTGTSLSELHKGGEMFQSFSSGNSPSFIC
jgi:hypothetical protein